MIYVSNFFNKLVKGIIIIMSLLLLMCLISSAYNIIKGVNYNSLEVGMTKLIIGLQNNTDNYYLTKLTLLTVKLLSFSYMVICLFLSPLIILYVRTNRHNNH